MLKVKYFAYGSNIDIERLKNRVEFYGERVKEGEPYTLKDYNLLFNAGIDFSLTAFANIVPKKGSEVEGILYNLTPTQFDRLDQYEALYEKQFFPLDKDTIACTYVARQDVTTKKEKRPDLRYLNIIIDGCKATGLKKTYEKLVKFKIKNYKLKKGNKHKL